MNGEEISPQILGSSQIEGINVKVVRNKHTLKLSTNNCVVLNEGELDFGEELESLEVRCPLLGGLG